MPAFRYRARDDHGAGQAGDLIAANPTAAPAPGAADPTAPSVRLQQVMAAQAPEESGKVPDLAVKGLVAVKGRSPAALLEIKGAGYSLVRAGSTIVLPGTTGKAWEFTVKEVTAEGVLLTVKNSQETIQIR